MNYDKVRLGQIVGLYGPGSMLDLPERSVLVRSIDDWEMFGTGTFQTIQEPRLSRLLFQRLADQDGRLVADHPPELRTPPIDPGDPRRTAPGVKATVFPLWFVCDAVAGDKPHRRRMVRFQDLDPPRYLEHRGDDGKRRKASPIRFVCGCEDGHLQDIEWRRILHQEAKDSRADRSGQCREQMWLEDGGTSADPRDTRIACDCGASISLEQLFQKGRLGPCRGERPWIGDRDPSGCPHDLRLLIRSATNTYFPQVAKVISLPQTLDELDRRIDAVWSVIATCTTLGDLQAARRFNPQVKANLEGYGDEEVLSRLQTTSQAAGTPVSPEDPRIEEFRLLASGKALIGENRPNALLHAETLNRDIWDPEGDDALSGVASLVAVHRLREVACLYGFTRFEPAPMANDDLEDVGLAVSGAPLGIAPAWLPAVEQFGEGLFLLLSRDKLKAWLARKEVLERKHLLELGASGWIAAKQSKGMQVSIAAFRERVRPEYVMAHTLSHALMAEVAIDCGYPASSIKERVYVPPQMPGNDPVCGILIYTATAGTQGTLGGLVEVANRFASVMKAALERERLCSNDPVCADHDPSSADEDRQLHGAACHGCVVIAETSCEARNVFLDRALLVDTVGSAGAGFFRT